MFFKLDWIPATIHVLLGRHVVSMGVFIRCNGESSSCLSLSKSGLDKSIGSAMFIAVHEEIIGHLTAFQQAAICL